MNITFRDLPANFRGAQIYHRESLFLTAGKGGFFILEDTEDVS